MKSRMDELGFLYAWTPVYSPQYNGIEEVINIGKQMIKKRRLEAILDNEEICLNDEIIKAFKCICPIQIAKCLCRSLNLLNLSN